MRAAVLRQTGDEKLDVVSDAGVVDTEPGFVRVHIHATGVCHSDLSAMNGTIPQPAPAVLGHEGAGEVVEVGPGVTSVSVGDHVIVVWVPPCGRCSFCIGGQPNLCSEIMMSAGFSPRFIVDGQPAFGMAGTGTFCDEVVLPEQSVVKVDDDVPWEIASLIGCGVMTGVGAAINAAKVVPGSTVAVYGCGGVGVSVIQGARVAGAAEILAIDPVAERREDALRFGATHTASPDEVEAAKGEITGGVGFDYAFEVVGKPATIRGAYDATRRGGTTVIVGVGRMEEMVEFSAFELFYAEKTMLGTIYGSADVRRDFNRMIRLWRTGRLDLESMITKRRPIEDINAALDDMRAGRVIRTVVDL
jgi:S-(hydroxymethyl)glutathione dehydrogenase / alcohol dehydrogenase